MAVMNVKSPSERNSGPLCVDFQDCSPCRAEVHSGKAAYMNSIGKFKYTLLCSHYDETLLLNGYVVVGQTHPTFGAI